MNPKASYLDQPLFVGQKRCIGICLKRMKQTTRLIFGHLSFTKGKY